MRISHVIVMIFLLVVMLILLSPAVPAHAMDMSLRGSTVTIHGTIQPGDEFSFRDFLKGENVTQIECNSWGGDIDAAIAIARQIRAAKLTTVVKNKDECASAGTIIFAGGVKRIYSTADVSDLYDFSQNPRGLGFHHGHEDEFERFGIADANLNNAYYEFGVEKVILIYQYALPSQLYVLSTADAKILGISTD